QDTAGALVAALGGGLHVIAVDRDQGELRGDEGAAGQHEQEPDRQRDEGTDQIHGRIPPWEVNECRPEGLGLSLGAPLAALMISWCSWGTAPSLGGECRNATARTLGGGRECGRALSARPRRRPDAAGRRRRPSARSRRPRARAAGG